MPSPFESVLKRSGKSPAEKDNKLSRCACAKHAQSERSKIVEYLAIEFLNASLEMAWRCKTPPTKFDGFFDGSSA
jgi:hypothetical protein